MTFEELLGYDSTQWASISDEELFKVLEPFFIVTRPEKITKSDKGGTGSSGKTTKNSSFASLQKELMSLATKQGIILPTHK